MNLTIPVFAVEIKQPNSPTSSITVRPLFVPHFVETAETLARALHKLSNTLRQHFDQIGEQARHDEIVEHTFSPVLEEKTLKINLELRNNFIETRQLFVAFPAFGRKIAFAPNLPEVWFELARNEDLETRATEVLTAYWREVEKSEGKDAVRPERFKFDGRAFLTTLEIFLDLPQIFESKSVNIFSLLGEEDVGGGADELRRVGRNLDLLYPDDLERVAGREKELAELTKLLDSKDRRPILLLGKRLVGKTALLHEYIFRSYEAKAGNRTEKEQTWLLAPSRLISGMSYVGQWEQRLLVILKEARDKKHLLYFDDFLGLFQAGISRDSSLNAAQVLKPYVERREVRVIAEMTPEALRIFRERDRGFADLFQILRLEETAEEETLKILLAVRRNLEGKHKSNFAVEALPTVLDLQRRYVRDAAFPGKAANFMRQLSIKYRDAEITRQGVLDEFRAKSGMNVNFLDDRITLERAEVVRRLSAEVIGQNRAITAAADVITLAKARLNDTARPLASFLFLGPTGVGKTETAKQIAAYLFGAPDKLLRFDMNEFVSPYDVSRLVGTFDQPEGLLTSAVRRQPFSVVLLDEIEKAHSDVFNLLLQVTGDGRLTDSLGRTTDFSNAIVILTSNLGAREATGKLGFRQSGESESQVYLQAAEKFFRPEFFNRFDRIIPFERLRREDVEQIARKLIQNVFRRDGLIRRNCKLQIEDAALRKIVDEGYLPELGARALKRAVERRLTAPVAVRLAAFNPTAPTIISLTADAEKNEIVVNLEELLPIDVAESFWLNTDFSDIDENLNRIEDELENIEAQTEALKPHGAVNVGETNAEAYFLIREHFKRVERMIERAERWQERDEKQDSATPQNPVRRPSKNPPRRLVSIELNNEILQEAFAVRDLAAWLKNKIAEAENFGEKLSDYVQDIWRETVLLRTFAENVGNASAKKIALIVSSKDEQAKPHCEFLIRAYAEIFAAELGLKVQSPKSKVQSPKSKVQSPKPGRGDAETRRHADSAEEENACEEVLILEGVHALPLAQAEAGIHLFITDYAGFLNIEVEIKELNETKNEPENPDKTEPDENPKSEIRNPKSNNPKSKIQNPKSKVVRIYKQTASTFTDTLDLRTGLIANEMLTSREMRTFILSGLAVGGYRVSGKS